MFITRCIRLCEARAWRMTLCYDFLRKTIKNTIMKKIILLLLIVSCSQEETNRFVGTWVMYKRITTVRGNTRPDSRGILFENDEGFRLNDNGSLDGFTVSEAQSDYHQDELNFRYEGTWQDKGDTLILEGIKFYVDYLDESELEITREKGSNTINYKFIKWSTNN